MEAGRVTRVFSPDEVYTRHSEGDFLRLKDGSLLFVYCRFQGSWHDDSHSEIVGCVSRDEGETWSEAKTLIDPKLYGVENVMSVSLMRMENGDVGLFYLVKVTPGHSRIMLSRSSDEGKTFSEHTECSDPGRPFYLVVNNSRAERLKSGRIVLPAAYHRAACGADGKWYVDYRATAVFLLSDDDGRTWREGPEMIYPPFTDTVTGLQEPGVIERGGGLYAYFRTDKHCQYESLSLDGGEHWSMAQPSRFTSPVSPLKLLRREEKEIYAFWNPIPEYNGRAMNRSGWGRTPMVAAVSRDDGATWSEAVTVAEEAERGYCYPAGFFTSDGHLLLAYCSGGPEEKACLAQLTIRKIPLDVFC